MTKFIGWRLALSFAVVLIAVIATTAIGTGQAEAHDLHTLHGFCMTTEADGTLAFDTEVTSHTDFGELFPDATTFGEWCEANGGGGFVTVNQKDRLQGTPGNEAFPELTTTLLYPSNFFLSPETCRVLPSTDGSGDDINRLEDVFVAKGVEVGLQIAYDIGSNEVTGITGAVIGVILGVVKVPAFVAEWKYGVQDECQGILTSNLIQAIDTTLNGVARDQFDHEGSMIVSHIGQNTDTKGLFAAHNTNIDGDLATHDSDLKGVVAERATDIEGALGTHDDNLDGDLAAHDSDL